MQTEPIRIEGPAAPPAGTPPRAVAAPPALVERCDAVVLAVASEARLVDVRLVLAELEAVAGGAVVPAEEPAAAIPLVPGVRDGDLAGPALPAPGTPLVAAAAHEPAVPAAAPVALAASAAAATATTPAPPPATPAAAVAVPPTLVIGAPPAGLTTRSRRERVLERRPRRERPFDDDADDTRCDDRRPEDAPWPG